jgi:hypothetical protein
MERAEECGIKAEEKSLPASAIESVEPDLFLLLSALLR